MKSLSTLQVAQTRTRCLITFTLVTVLCLNASGCRSNSGRASTPTRNTWTISQNRSFGGSSQSQVATNPDAASSSQASKPNELAELPISSEFDTSTIPVPPAGSQPTASGPIDSRRDQVALVDDAASTASLTPVEPPTLEEATEILTTLGARISRDFEGNARTIDLAFTSFNHSHAELLPLFTGLSELDLTGTDIGDSVLKQVADLTLLQSLKLKGTDVSDAGIEHLAGLSQLKILDLGRTKVSDAALTHLRGMKELNYLVLHHTGVTDAGLVHLKMLKKLRGLNVIESQITSKGVDQLEEDLPRCLVVLQAGDDVSFIHLPAEFTVEVTTPVRNGAPTTKRDGQLRRLQQLAHQDPELAQQLAEVYSDKGQWQNAVAILRAAAAASPDDVHLQTRLAEALAYSGESDEAYELLSSLVGEAAASYTIGTVIYDVALTTSESYLQRSVTMAPHNAQARRRLDELKAAKLWGKRKPTQSTPISTVSMPRIIPRSRITPPPVAIEPSTDKNDPEHAALWLQP